MKLKNNLWLKILAIFILVVVCAASLIIPTMTNADGGGGAGTGGGSGGATAEGQRGGFAYAWHDDPTFKPSDDGSTYSAPDQGWCTRTTAGSNACSDVTDATFNFWMGKLSDQIGGTALTWYNRERWVSIRAAMKQACMNALARDPESNHARIVGVAVVWNNYPYANHDVSYPAWIPGWGNNINANPRTFENLFDNTVPSPSWLSTSDINDWGGVVDQSYFNGALDNETWAHYIYRIGAEDNNDSSLWTKHWVFYVVAATDNMPFRQVPKDVYLKVTKTVPTGYTVTGAKFGVYATQANANSDTNRLTTLTIGSNGTSEIAHFTLDSGETSKTVYVKEVSPPTQTGDFDWIMDTSVQSITLTESNKTEATAGLLSFSNNIRQYGYIQVNKTVPSDYSAQGATFGVYNSSSDATNNTNRLTTLTIGSDGKSGTYRIALPEGLNKSKTVYVKELTAPTQSGDFDWIIDAAVKSYTITASHTSTSPYVFNISNNVQKYGYLSVKKVGPSGHSTMGATFGVYASEANARANTNRLTTLTIGTDSFSETYRFKLPVDASATTTLYVKELTAPAETGDFVWNIDSSVHTVAIPTNTTSTNPKVEVINNTITEYGYLKIHKNVPTGYSAQGATFGVYASQADANSGSNRLHLFTIGANGDSTNNYKVELPVGGSKTVYIKELTAPTQSGNFTWVLDTTVHTGTITAASTANNPVMVNFTNKTSEYGYGQVYKSAPTGYSPKDAEYTIYTDAACTTPAPASIFASGTVEKFIIKADGSSNKIKFIVPTGGSLTVYVKETKLPSYSNDSFEWKIDTGKYKMTMSVTNSETKPVRVDSENKITTLGYGYIIKTSDKARVNDLLVGAKFTVYKSDGTTIAKDYKTGANVILNVKFENGKYVTDQFCLETGNYVIKETTTPTGFDTAEPRTITIEQRTSDNPQTFTVQNHYRTESAYVLKSSDRPELISVYPLTGTKIGIYTDSACTTLAKDINTGADCILTVQSNLKTNTVELPLGTYYAKEISTTQWYDLNEEPVTVRLTNDGGTFEIELENYLQKGLGKVEKGFKNSGSN